MINNIWAAIKQDYWYICIVLVVLSIALYALATIKDYENQCNEHWLQEMEHCNCACINRPADPWMMPNTTFPIIYGGDKDG